VSFERRLRQLEARLRDSGATPSTPLELRVYFSTMERLKAREEDRQPRSYTQEEIEHLRRGDLEIAAGGGVVGLLRHSVGWKSDDCQAGLDAWEEDARRRVEAAKDLPPERWREVWGGEM
jgi:hypothetical protein